MPKPIGVFTWTDVRGCNVTEACTYAGLRVPDDVAVLGGEYDELSSAVSNPPLSTVNYPEETVGRRAAMLLHDRLWGQPFPDDPVYIEPLGVLSRQSTDTLAIEDSALRQAIAVLREHAFEPIHIKQLLDLVPMSRRQFELSCKDVLGRTPAEELRRLRLERAKGLLVDTDDAINSIAEQVGFNHAEVLNRSFRTHVSMTPTAFRKWYQRRI
ncbi:MAG: helix-turn-helix domain-containing protein [Rhodospirillales bacterium]|nr:helix-turn-helix domain-containing protein [Rhodospirillales bacterium]